MKYRRNLSSAASWEGEAPAEPRTLQHAGTISGSAGASPSRTTTRLSIIFASIAMCLVADLHADEISDLPTSRSHVGVAVQIGQIVISGTELEAKPVDDRKAPIVVRILGTFRHGSDFRYDIEFYGLEPGRFDLRDSLQRKDRSSMDGVAPLWVEIGSRLPPGQIVPSDFSATSVPNVGGYRAAMYALFAVWGAVTLWLAMGRRRARATAHAVEYIPTLAERLRPLVTQAVAGQLSAKGQAELERLLLGYWRTRLGLTDMEPFAALLKIQQHSEAGAVLRFVEEWLHRDGGGRAVDMTAVLAPYQHAVDETIQEPLPVAMAGGR